MTERAPALVPIPGAAPRPIVPLWGALLLALGAGPVTAAAYPTVSIWPLVLAGIALVLVSLVGRRFWSAALIGFVWGLSYYLTLITWASTFLGLVPMTALAFAMAAYISVGSGLIALAYRWLPRLWPGTAGRMLVLPIAIAGLWTTREAIESVWPYGGFAWGRMGQAMIDSPVAKLYAWVGISGMTFLMVWLVALVVEAVCYRGVDGLRRALVPVGLATAMAVWPAWHVATTGSIRVAMVQGDGPAGYFDESRQPGDLLRAQLLATEPLFGTEGVDLVLWPEGSSDWDPTADPGYTGAAWSWVATQMGAPLLAQAVTERGDESFNTAILWEPGEGAVDTFDKRHPVPFGEYIPDRAFYELLAPDLVNLVGRDYTPGTNDPVMSIPTSAGPVEIAIGICYDIVDDALLRESALDGGQVLLSSSNNADFGPTNESAQQLAIARIRAIELGRSLANVSTVGITAVIAPDGTVLQRLPWYTPGTIVADIALADTITPDAAAGQYVEVAAGGIGIALLLGAGLSLVPSRSRRRLRTRT